MNFLALCSILLIELIVADDFHSPMTSRNIRLPAEWEPHLRTFMVWPASEEIWSAELLPGVRSDIASIAKAIVPFEPVVMLAEPAQVAMARTQLDPKITVVPMPVDDLWARDTLPVFVLRNRFGLDRLMGMVFNFNGWGKKQIHSKDAQVAERVDRLFGIEKETAKIVAEGGSFETDGKGTLLVTKSSLVNPNRNNDTIEEIETELKRVLGVKKIIWFEGVIGGDITDAHVDCLVRFVRPGVVIINRPFPGQEPDVWSKSSDDALEVLKQSTDVDGNPFKVIDLVEPDPDKIIIKGNATTFLASYANFLIGNGFVVIPEFGDAEADSKAKSTLQELFPDRKVISVLISTLASGGGGIHCATHEEPSDNNIELPTNSMPNQDFIWNLG